MSKISLVIQREYLSRVRKRSFIVMSILGPFIFAAYILIPLYLATLEDKEEKTVVVIDESMLFTEFSEDGPKSVIPDTEYTKFIIIEDVSLETFKAGFEETGYYAVLFIPTNLLASEAAVLYSSKQVSLDVSGYVRRFMEREIERLKLSKHEIQDIDRILAEVETSISMRSIKWTKDGKTQESNTGVIMAVSYMSGLLIFFFIFSFGSQVMRGVIEEKTSRIIEVIVSSVKPFQLMMGKIIGVGLTGLTQLIIWGVFSTLLVSGLKAAFFPQLNESPTEQVLGSDLFNPAAESSSAASQALLKGGPSTMMSGESMDMIQEVLRTLRGIHAGEVIIAFIFFFVFGYLLYASMFAVVGSAVDNETDTRQLILPVVLPLIIGIYVLVSAMNSPDSSVPFWFSMIPFTSPIVMMARLPFGVPSWQLWTSITLLIGTFLGMTWIAGKVYRTGILMYGKKNNFREIWKWLRYRS